MEKITTNFAKFKQKKVDKQQKTGVFQPLSDDITAVFKNAEGNYEKIEGPVEIVQILDIVKDPKEIEKIEEGIVMDTSLSIKEIKRGQMLYLTALLQKPGTASFTQQTISIVQVRVIDYWFGLNKLNQIIQK
jgi:hypothetical protein